MVVMVQKEVAEAIVAKQGKSNVLSVSVHLYGQPKIITYVPAQSFYPIPGVDSAILQIKLYPQPLYLVNEDSFFQLVRAAFSSPRKQIINSLAQGLKVSRSDAVTLLDTANIDYHRRPGTLNLDEFVRLWESFDHGG
jgi:16S rRNA (adenine1518-N6/adenine1519-N6)-dimethyltransferase